MPRLSFAKQVSGDTAVESGVRQRVMGQYEFDTGICVG